MTERSPDRGASLMVAVTGHRPNRMPEQHWPRVKRQLANVMRGIETRHSGRRLMLLSGLAEGTDRLAAFVALGRGWSLAAVLAFHRTRFEQDFAEPDSVGEFRALLAATDERHEPRRQAHTGRPATDGYQRVGQYLLSKADILIAVWDGEASRGKGGAVEVIEAARCRGLPVVWIHATKLQPPRWLETYKPAKPSAPSPSVFSKRQAAHR